MVLFGKCLSAEEALGAELTGVIVEADELPTTTTGKVQRRELRTGDED